MSQVNGESTSILIPLFFWSPLKYKHDLEWNPRWPPTHNGNLFQPHLMPPPSKTLRARSFLNCRAMMGRYEVGDATLVLTVMLATLCSALGKVRKSPMFRLLNAHKAMMTVRKDDSTIGRRQQGQRVVVAQTDFSVRNLGRENKDKNDLLGFVVFHFNFNYSVHHLTKDPSPLVIVVAMQGPSCGLSLLLLFLGCALRSCALSKEKKLWKISLNTRRTKGHSDCEGIMPKGNIRSLCDWGCSGHKPEEKGSSGKLRPNMNEAGGNTNGPGPRKFENPDRGRYWQIDPQQTQTYGGAIRCSKIFPISPSSSSFFTLRHLKSSPCYMSCDEAPLSRSVPLSSSPCIAILHRSRTRRIFFSPPPSKGHPPSIQATTDPALMIILVLPAKFRAELKRTQSPKVRG